MTLNASIFSSGVDEYQLSQLSHLYQLEALCPLATTSLCSLQFKSGRFPPILLSWQGRFSAKNRRGNGRKVEKVNKTTSSVVVIVWKIQ